jgi:GNAT superfamily N-acetyltransferase
MARDLDRIPTDDQRHEVVPFEPSPRDGELPYRTGTDPAHVTHLSVRAEGGNVGQVIVNSWRRYAGIYNMGVAASHRRRGIGRALTLAACRLAKELGCTHALLNATPEGELLYRMVGFTSLGMGATWWLHPGRHPTPRQTVLVEAIGLGGVEEFASLRPTRAELERPIPGPGPPLVVTANTRAAKVADWILRRRPELVNQRFDTRGETLLHLAVEGNDAALARVALAHGADPEVRDRAYNGTPLGWARHLGHPGLAALLS